MPKAYYIGSSPLVSLTRCTYVRLVEGKLQATIYHSKPLEVSPLLLPSLGSRSRHLVSVPVDGRWVRSLTRNAKPLLKF